MECIECGVNIDHLIHPDDEDTVVYCEDCESDSSWMEHYSCRNGCCTCCGCTC